LDVEATAKSSVDKALEGRAPRKIKPGHYEVILEPAAVSNLLSSFVWVQMNAKAVDEGRSYLSGKKGTRLVAPSIDMYSDPMSTQCPACPFDREGMKIDRVNWIRNGVVENLLYSRFWAKKQGCAFTGWPHNMIIRGGKTSREDMIKSTKRGLLITRFWYIRTVDRMRDLYTGTTRDGTFLVKNGEVVGPVKNLRFNDSAVRLLNSVQAIGEQGTTTGMGISRVPLIKAGDFNFTSTTDF
jgi:predicted Zn-dependent protease